MPLKSRPPLFLPYSKKVIPVYAARALRSQALTMSALREMGRRLLPLGVRTGAQRLKARVRAKTALARLSHWETLELGARGRPYRIVYAGLKSHRPLVTTVFNTPSGD